MKLLLISDLHGNVELIDKLKTKICNTHVVVFAGDITNFGDQEAADDIINKVLSLNKNVICVTGNCDFPAVEKNLLSRNLSVHTCSQVNSGFVYCGFGGSLLCPGKTPNVFSEAEITKGLQSAISGLQDPDKTIFVVHHPPYNTLCDKLTSGEHAGSHSVRKAIEDFQPRLCLTGHIHEASGVDRIGVTKIVNPGSGREGNYAEINIDNSNVQIDLKVIAV